MEIRVLRWGVGRGGRVVVLAFMVWVAGLVFGSSALGMLPTGEYAVFSQCPRFTRGVALCLFAQITSGEISVGGAAIPITRTVTLRGGLTFDEESEAETFVGALNGESLSNTPLTVPGGLRGLVAAGSLPSTLRGAFQETLARGLTSVTATDELAGVPQVNTNNIVNAEGTGLSLPLRIKLDNPFLGNACYIGSSAHPVTLNMTTGSMTPPPPNKPIMGSVGDLTFILEGKLDEILGLSLVDNSFAVPVANGCGGAFSSVLDPIIDAKMGLPSAAGQNTAIENGDVEDALAKTVIASEK